MKYCVIFDVDGTLFDTSEGICDCTRYAIAQVGYPPLDEKLLPRFIGPSLYHSFTVTAGMDGETALRAIEHYRERYQKTGIDLSRPYDGIADTLARLHSEDFTLTVASNKPLSMVRYLLGKYDFTKYFSAVFAPDFATRSSDKSELVAAASLGERNIMVGDTEFDVTGAHKAGVRAIAVSYGFGVEGTLGEADFIAATPAEICEIVERDRQSK